MLVESDHLLCPLCRAWADELVVAPCCGFRFCASCWSRSTSCGKCRRPVAVPVTQLATHQSYARQLARVLKPCPHAGCDQQMSPVLLASHAEACRHAPHNNCSDLQALQLANLLRAFPAVNAHGTRQREPDGREIITYVIAEGDTFAGISLRFGVSVQAIQRENRMSPSSSLFERVTLRIPVPAHADENFGRRLDEAALLQLLKRRLMAKFQRVAKQQHRPHGEAPDDQEADYYLDAANWDLQVALAAFADDEQWALQNSPAPKSHSTSTTSITPGAPHSSPAPTYFSATPGGPSSSSHPTAAAVVHTRLHDDFEQQPRGVLCCIFPFFSSSATKRRGSGL